jgi:hypothetical protein
MIGLATSGLIEGVSVIGRIQTQAGHAVAEGQAMREAQRRLERLLDGQGPFDATAGAQLDGDRQAFSFDCGEPEWCGASLQAAGRRMELEIRSSKAAADTLLPASVERASFVYGGAGGLAESWPPAEPGRQVLRSVGLRSAAGATIADVRLWTEQPRRCDFDAVAQVCRSATP